MRRLDDPELVREQYETEHALAARKAVYRTREGPSAHDVAIDAIAEVKPRRVLEVGGGEGELAERIMRELGAELVGVDQSPRMVEIQRGRGIDARVGDAQNLPFDECDFDVVLAAWVLFHVSDVSRALSEFARVLRPTGRLVAVTNSVEHCRELWDLAGAVTTMREAGFRSENGEAALRPHFARVERRDVRGWFVMDDDAVLGYTQSWEPLRSAAQALPLAEPLRVRYVNTVFVAETASGA